jgi:phosphatidylserine synthase
LIILAISALWMARTDQETDDGWFRGFPAEWNMIIPTLYLIDANRWANLAICVALRVLTVSRVQFPHPVSVRDHRAITLPSMLLWIGSMTWLAIAQRRIWLLQFIIAVSPLWTVWMVVRRNLFACRGDTRLESTPTPP